MNIIFSRSIVCRQGKSISRLNISSSKNKMKLIPWWKHSNTINLLPGNRVVA
jgi:hypothetical protein